MNGKINVDLKTLKFIFDRNKAYIIPAVIILTSLVLFWQFVVPQFKILFTAQEEARQASLKLQALKEDLNVLKNTDEKFLDEKFKILNFALPPGKDFSGILNSIYSASQKSGVDLGAFSLQIGDLSEAKKEDSFPTISLSVPVNANAAGVNRFIDVISKTFPISEVTSIKTNDLSSTVKLSFYYKPLGFSGYEDNMRISPISQKGLTIIDKLSGFENASTFQREPAASSSSVTD